MLDEQHSHTNSALIITARRCAKRGICRHWVSVCHTPVLYQNG